MEYILGLRPDNEVNLWFINLYNNEDVKVTDFHALKYDWDMEDVLQLEYDLDMIKDFKWSADADQARQKATEDAAKNATMPKF